MPSDSDSDKPPGESGSASSSGSVDVAFSNTKLDAVPAVPVDVEDSQPITSGSVKAPITTGESGSIHSPGRSRRITQAVQGAVTGGVEKLGSSIGSIGEGVTKIGEAIPLVGVGIERLGEGIAKAGESIHALPAIAQTKRGALLVRSVIVGFLIVFSWIAAIVAWQVRGNETPDFRPAAERILIKLSEGEASLDDLYEHASPRFQEMVRKGQFVDDMIDLHRTVGKFLELTAIHDTLVTTGPTGRIGRVSLTASYEQGLCKGSISFHWDKGEWKLLGVGIELPPDLKITPEIRNERVKLCDDPMSAKTCEIHRVADGILHAVFEGQAGEVWDKADSIFKKQETRDKFVQISDERRNVLGKYLRLITVTEAKSIKGTCETAKGLVACASAGYDVLAEFEKSSGVRVVFSFERGEETDPWLLRAFKVVLPMPRADEAVQVPGLPSIPLPASVLDAGVATGADAGAAATDATGSGTGASPPRR